MYEPVVWSAFRSEDGTLGDVAQGLARSSSPGAGLSGVLGSVELPGLSDEDLIDVIAGWERLAAWAQAGQMAAIAEFGQRRAVEEAEFLAAKSRDNRARSSVAPAADGAAPPAADQPAESSAESEFSPVVDGVARMTAQDDVGLLRVRPLDEPRAGDAAERFRRLLTQMQMLNDARLLGEGVRERPAVSRFAVGEISAVLNLGPIAASNRLKHAMDVVFRLPGVFELMQQGHIDSYRVKIIADATARLSALRARQVEQRILPRLTSMTIPDLRKALAEAILAVDGDQAEQRHRRARADRRVTVRPLPDGMASFWALLPAEGAQQVWEAIDAAAGVGASDCTLAQRRADALVALGAQALSEGMVAGQALPSGQGRRPHILITIPVEVMLGWSNGPADLAGYGPVSAAVARTIAAAGDWRAAITSAHGTLLHYGRRSYTPIAAVRDAVLARDMVCRFPGCTRTAWRCDLDHTVPHPAGPTCDCNLAALCRSHHVAKHQAGWRLVQLDGGVLEWTSPTGHVYSTAPHHYPPALISDIDGHVDGDYQMAAAGTIWPDDTPPGHPGSSMMDAADLQRCECSDRDGLGHGGSGNDGCPEWTDEETGRRNRRTPSPRGHPAEPPLSPHPPPVGSPLPDDPPF